MKNVAKIVIKGSSGYGPSEMAYNDKLKITDCSIAYEYKPLVESEMNFSRKWSYKSNGAVFKDAFERISSLIEKSLKQDIRESFTDIGAITFSIEYSDGSKRKEEFWLPSDYFSELFDAIKELVPRTECIPEVLKTEEDYDME